MFIDISYLVTDYLDFRYTIFSVPFNEVKVKNFFKDGKTLICFYSILYLWTTFTI